MDPVNALRTYRGVARWAELQRAGVARSSLLEACDRGLVTRPHRGVFALPRVPREDVLARVFRADLCCISWCQGRDLPVYPAPSVSHLAVPQSRAMGLPRSRPVDEVVMHRVASTPRTAAEQVDLSALCIPPREQLALVDASLRRGLISREEVEAFTHGSRERRAWLFQMADARSESLSETCARVELVEAGLDVTPQYEFPAVGRVDFLVEGAVVVEIDSEAHHSGEKARARDGRRDRASTTQGSPALRYMFHDALERPAEIVDDVVATLMRMDRLTPTVRTKLARAARVSGWRALH